MKKYTVLWADPGDTTFNRLDHVEAPENDLKAIMNDCFDIFEMEIKKIDPEAEPVDRENTPYDLYAIFEGHIYEAPIPR